MRLPALTTLIGFHLFAISSALAQTTPPGVTAAPELATGRAYWLWIIVAVVFVAMGIWYFTSRRRRR
jgi:type III secretory pathway component EscU